MASGKQVLQKSINISLKWVLLDILFTDTLLSFQGWNTLMRFPVVSRFELATACWESLKTSTELLCHRSPEKVVSVICQLLNVGLFRNSSQPSISLFLALTFFSLSLEKEKKFFFLPQAFVYFTSSTLFSIYLFHFDGFGVFNRVPWLRAHWLRLRDAKGIRRNWRKARWLVIRCR